MSNEPLNPRSSVLLDPGDLDAAPRSEKWALAVLLGTGKLVNVSPDNVICEEDG